MEDNDRRDLEQLQQAMTCLSKAKLLELDKLRPVVEVTARIAERLLAERVAVKMFAHTAEHAND